MMETPTTEMKTCKNCDHEYQGNFCPNCGQSSKRYDKPFNLLVVDFVGTFFAFDTRFFRTIFYLFFFPGKIENDFVAGKRVRYMPPLRLYIFISFFFFLSYSFVSKRAAKNAKEEYTHMAENSGDTVFDNSQLTMDSFADIFDTLNAVAAKQQSDIGVAIEEDEEGEDGLEERLKSIIDNPQYFIEKFFKYASWSCFLLMPFYALLMKMLFIRQRKYYIYHLVLSINQHAFTFFIFTIILVIQLIFPNKTVYPEFWLLLLPPVYQAIGLRKLNRNSWGKILLKGFLLNSTYFLVIFTIIVIILVQMI